MKPPAPEGDEKFRILAVEDDSGIAQVILALLEPLGFDCRHAQDGSGAILAFHQFEPHLVMLDLMMPGMSGIEVLTRIREKSTVPVIVLTALDEHAQGLQAFKIGADDYIVKPFDPKMMMARVIAQLRRAYRYDGPEPAPVREDSPRLITGAVAVGSATCDNCGYTGAHEEFETESITGKRELRCPRCHKTDYVSYDIE